MPEWEYGVCRQLTCRGPPNRGWHGQACQPGVLSTRAVLGPTCGQRQEEVVHRWADMRSPHKDSELWDRTSVERVLSPCACECSGLGWQRWLPSGPRRGPNCWGLEQSC